MVCYGVKRKLWYQWFDMWVVYVIEKKKNYDRKDQYVYGIRFFFNVLSLIFNMRCCCVYYIFKF